MLSHNLRSIGSPPELPERVVNMAVGGTLAALWPHDWGARLGIAFPGSPNVSRWEKPIAWALRIDNRVSMSRRLQFSLLCHGLCEFCGRLRVLCPVEDAT